VNPIPMTTAQYFTVSDPRFKAMVDDWLEAGVVKKWEGPVGTLTLPAPALQGPPGLRSFQLLPPDSPTRCVAQRLHFRAPSILTLNLVPILDPLLPVPMWLCNVQ
jgi:hypothetical protein